MGNKHTPEMNRQGVSLGWADAWSVEHYRDGVQLRCELMRRIDSLGIRPDRTQLRAAGDRVEFTIFHSLTREILNRRSALQSIQKLLQTRFRKVTVSVQEHQGGYADPFRVLHYVIRGIESRQPYRRVLNGAIRYCRNTEAIGARIEVRGRLNGREIAGRDRVEYGRVPLMTLSAAVASAQGIARMRYGVIGVKVWIHREHAATG